MGYKIYTDAGVFDLKKINEIGFFEFELCGELIAIDGIFIKNLKAGDLFLDLPVLKIEKIKEIVQ